VSNQLVRFGEIMPMREAPGKGTLRIEFVYRADDGTFLTFHGDVDRWASTALLIGKEDAIGQLLRQMTPIFGEFCREIKRRYGLADDRG
jgi:hypothetical protein